jgi:hypothetical protein
LLLAVPYARHTGTGSMLSTIFLRRSHASDEEKSQAVREMLTDKDSTLSGSASHAHAFW